MRHGEVIVLVLMPVASGMVHRFMYSLFKQFLGFSARWGEGSKTQPTSYVRNQPFRPGGPLLKAVALVLATFVHF